jgi:hypothetical protein
MVSGLCVALYLGERGVPGDGGNFVRTETQFGKPSICRLANPVRAQALRQASLVAALTEPIAKVGTAYVVKNVVTGARRTTLVGGIAMTAAQKSGCSGMITDASSRPWFCSARM